MQDINRRTYLIELFDLYKNLVTNKQKEYFSKFYLDDLSLFEISELFCVTRNSAFDSIKLCEKKLLDYEKNLGLYKKLDKISSIVSNNIFEKILDIIKEE